MSAVKNRILKRSFRLFANKGYEGTKMKDISKAVKVNKATIYYYFDSKADLYKSVLYMQLKNLINSITSTLVNTEVPLNKRIERLVDFYFEYVKANRLVLKLLLREVVSGAKFLKEVLKEIAQEESIIKQGGIPKIFERELKIDTRKFDPLNLWLNILGMIIVHHLMEPFIEVFHGKSLDDEFLLRRKKDILNFIEQALR